PNLFAPTALTFSIWGVIYLLLGAHVLYQLGLFQNVGAGDEQPEASDASARQQLLERVGVLFSASSLANAAWILAWHYDLIGLSTALLMTMLVLLIAITRTVIASATSLRDRVFLRLPFSVYFGWLTVATIANITVWLVSIGWDGFGVAESTWAVAIIAVGALVGSVVILRDRDIAYGLVLVWAYFGIWLKHTSASGFAGAHPDVIAAVIAGIAAFVVVGVVALVRRPAVAVAAHA
ncbi:MAG: tryptophan-rich sensory protein, partial [Actinomycetes bacterium]